MEIRRLVESEWQAYRALRLEALETNPEAFGATLEETLTRPVESWTNRLKPDPNNFLLGAWEGDRLVGMVGFMRISAPKETHRGSIYSMYVTPAFRRGGTGRQLLLGLLEEARKIPGLIQVDLSVVAENEPAKRLYESIGFVTYGRAPRVLKHGDRYLDEYEMIYFLDGYQMP